MSESLCPRVGVEFSMTVSFYLPAENINIHKFLHDGKSRDHGVRNFKQRQLTSRRRVVRVRRMFRLGLLLMSLTWALSAESEGKLWIFSVSGNRRPYNYADETGKLVGFELDIIDKVCSTAGVKCAPTVQPFSECTQTVDGRFFPGRGLMSGWFDACMGYTITQERVNAVQFTSPYIQTYAKLTVKPGNPRGVSLNTLSQTTITHLNGAYTNQQCLNRLNYSVGGVVVAANLPVAKELVLNGTVDAAFSPRSRIPDLETLNITLHCDLGGVAVMVTKGSTLPDWWNPAYEKFVKSGEYKKICETWRSKSTSSIKCFDDAHHAVIAGSGQTTAVVSWCLTATMLLVTLSISGPETSWVQTVGHSTHCDL
ncbi:uncharacterized protein LOC124114195 isoform X1 [Haliotis rufescens]|uniref:uncharacterized protein LOC124114195 isoform X1 n=2 Tax=Haliotis rufescens TaxID=6454 RepID=UPI00201EC23A|nr:uncharacterized protein LOC124114195 isoform X1 [Haliotis rufescens]